MVDRFVDLDAIAGATALLNTSQLNQKGRGDVNAGARSSSSLAGRPRALKA